MTVFHPHIHLFLHTVLYVHAYLAFVTIADHLHRATLDSDGGVTLEIGILQALHDGFGFIARPTPVVPPIAVSAFAASFSLAIHHRGMVATRFLTLATGLAAGAAMCAVAVLVAAGHLLVAAPTIRPATLAATTADEESGDAEEQAEDEDLALIGVHDGI